MRKGRKSAMPGACESDRQPQSPEQSPTLKVRVSTRSEPPHAPGKQTGYNLWLCWNSSIDGATATLLGEVRRLRLETDSPFPGQQPPY
jgi:hypothetical protein